MTLRIDDQVTPAFRRMRLTAPASLGVALDRAAVEVTNQAKLNAPSAFGTLRNSLTFTRPSRTRREIVAGFFKSRFVEEGTGTLGPTGRPSGLQQLPDAGIERIAQWIKRKGITPRTPGVTQEQLPWLIARKIARRGTPAQPFLGLALEAKRQRVVAFVAQGIRADTRKAGLA